MLFYIGRSRKLCFRVRKKNNCAQKFFLLCTLLMFRQPDPLCLNRNLKVILILYPHVCLYCSSTSKISEFIFGLLIAIVICNHLQHTCAKQIGTSFKVKSDSLQESKPELGFELVP